MMYRKTMVAALLFVWLFSACQKEQVSTSLPRSTPEAEGVSSQGILDFLDAVAAGPHELHSIMFVRHGKVIAEGWWNPYAPELKHTLYSLSKTFTSTAVGFAVSEQKLAVTDKVVSFFPDELPDTVSPFLADMEVRDLLSMTAGHDPDPTSDVVSKDSNWVKGFLSIPVLNDPGTKFLYNSLATYMLSAIVQQVTGEKVVDYLKPRLFQPLAIDGADWETDPHGINTGGWGLRVRTEDIAKVGQLYLQQGEWNGSQLIPAAWIEEASTARILQSPEVPQAQRDSSDWLQGYGYQIWRCRHNAFRGDGAFGQFMVVLPEQDAVVVITSESPDMQRELNLVWDYLLPAIKGDRLPDDAKSAELKTRLAALALPIPESKVDSPLAMSLSGKSFRLEPNERGLESLAFHFMGGMCHVTIASGGTSYNLSFGKGNWIPGETERLGPNLVMLAKAHFTGLPPSKLAASYSWLNENTLQLVLRYIESPHTETLTCVFDGDKINVTQQYSLHFGAGQTVIRGALAK